MSEAMDKLLEDRRKRKGMQETDARLLQLATSHADAMTQDLFDQIEEDLKRVEQEVVPGSILQINRTPTRITFGCEAGVSFSLKADSDEHGQPMIHCHEAGRKNPELPYSIRNFDIHLLAKGQGYFCYRLGGEDQGKEATSVALIAPFVALFD